MHNDRIALKVSTSWPGPFTASEYVVPSRSSSVEYSALRIHGTRQKDLRFARGYVIIINI